jgi:phosphoglycerate dehydrogenase-like enzyme
MTVLSALQHHTGVMSAVDVKALDAAMPFDFEHKAQARLTKAKQLTVGIVGFGTFGQFLARRLVQAGHKVHHPHMLPLMPHCEDARSAGMRTRRAGHTEHC